MITVIFSIIGISYAFLAPQVWRAKTIVVAPLPTQLEKLQFRLEKLFAMLGIASVDYSELRAAFSGTKLYADFIQAYDSYDNKSEFLKNTDLVWSGKNRDASILPLDLEKMTKNISVTQNQNDASATLAFSADNAQKARKLLVDYIRFIQSKEETAKNKLLAEKVTNQINVLTLNYQILEAETLKQLQEDITRTEYALRISETAGIETPVENLNNQGIFAIDFGAKALKEQLRILKEIKNPRLVNPVLANLRLKLDSLRAVPLGNVSFTSYHYLRSPSLPLDRDKPKRALVVVMATLVGLMAGILFALLHASFLSRDAVTQKSQSPSENKEGINRSGKMVSELPS